MLIALYSSRSHVGLPSPKTSETPYLNLFYFLEHTVVFLALFLSSVILFLLGLIQAKKEAI
jgi:MFS-type transporter involved in bile tolerance (Atg22 family)